MFPQSDKSFRPTPPLKSHKLWLNPNGVGFRDHQLHPTLRIKTFNAKCLAECSPEHSGCVDACRISQVRRNPHDPHTVANLERLGFMAEVRRSSVSSQD